MEAETWADSWVKCPAHSSLALWPPGGLKHPSGGAGRSALAEATLAWEQLGYSLCGYSSWAKHFPFVLNVITIL